jgi:molybdopterin-biosynthesis enzyme MoeA-like protein
LAALARDERPHRRRLLAGAGLLPAPAHLLSLLPLLGLAGLTFAAGLVLLGTGGGRRARHAGEGSLVDAALFEWLDSIGAPDLRTVLAPLIVVALAVPVIVLPPAAGGLADDAGHGQPGGAAALCRRCSAAPSGRVAGAGLVAACTLLALLALVLSMPLWLVPPLVLVLPPLIWGWLCYRVLAFDVLADHASAGRAPLQSCTTTAGRCCAAGVVCGLLGALPSLLWAAGALALVLAPLLMWCRCGCTRWCSPSRRCGSRTSRCGAAPPAPASRAAGDMTTGHAKQVARHDHPSMRFGLIIIGDEILSGKRQDKHLPKVIELLAARGLALAWARYVGDDRAQITAALRRLRRAATSSSAAAASAPRPTTTPASARRRGAGRAAGAAPRGARPDPAAHAGVAAEQGVAYEPDRPDNLHRLQMGVVPGGAPSSPNPYNRIPGFSVGDVHFVPGFPVMAHPMIEGLLDGRYATLHGSQRQRRTLGDRVRRDGGGADAADGAHRVALPGIKVFSLPSVDHPVHGRHIELGVKGPAMRSTPAFAGAADGLRPVGARWAPKWCAAPNMVRRCVARRCAGPAVVPRGAPVGRCRADGAGSWHAFC